MKKDSERFDATAGIPGNGTRLDDHLVHRLPATTSATSSAPAAWFQDPNLIKLTDVQGWAGANSMRVHYTPTQSPRTRSRRCDCRAHADLSFGPITAIDIGANFTERTKDRVTREGALIVGALDATAAGSRSPGLRRHPEPNHRRGRPHRHPDAQLGARRLGEWCMALESLDGCPTSWPSPRR